MFSGQNKDLEFLTSILAVKLLIISVLGKGPGEKKITAQSYFPGYTQGWLLGTEYFSLSYILGKMYIPTFPFSLSLRFITFV